MTSQHENFMKVALGEAKKSLAKRLLPVRAVLVVDGEIVSKSHKDEKHSYHLDHAEMLLLREYFKGKNIKRDEHDIAVYTTLEPCMMCLGTVLHLPINTLVFSLKDSYGGGCAILDSNKLSVRHKEYAIRTIGGILEDESKTLFKEFIEMNTMKFYSKDNKDNPLIAHILE